MVMPLILPSGATPCCGSGVSKDLHRLTIERYRSIAWCSNSEFRIIGVEDCFARGFQRMGFKEYDTGRQGSWMVQLSDAPALQESQN